MMLYYKTIKEIIDNNLKKEDWECPIDISIIPNQMGINLCSVNSIIWQRLDDGQLTYLTINFIPESKFINKTKE